MRYVCKKSLCVILIAFVSAVAMGFGCKHLNKGAIPSTLVEGPIDWGDTDKISGDVIGATPVEVGIHNIDLVFLTRMNSKTVDVVVTDENGEEVPFVSQSWNADRQVLHLKGPFRFCKQYNILLPAGAKNIFDTTLEEELRLSITTGKNPMDVDGTSSCTADYAMSPVFTDGPDVFLLTGDSVTAGGITEVRHPQDLAGTDVFYTDLSNRYDDADRTIVVPAIGKDGAAAPAKLFIKNGTSYREYALDVWGMYDPISEFITSSMGYEHLQNAREELRGPYNAGDINGDGRGDILMTAEITNIGGGVLQNIFVVTGPPAYGSNLSLEDQDSVNIIMGSNSEVLTPFISLGDVSGDGADDLGAMRSFASGSGGWQVWVVYGNKDMTKIFDSETMGKISSHPLGTIVDIDGGDVNGDGRSDVLVAEVERKYQGGRYWNLKPRVSVMFKDSGKDGVSTLSADSKLSVYSTYDTYPSVRSLGDINGDGYDDIAMLVTEKNASGNTMSSKIYIFKGRGGWYESYPLKYTSYASAVIDLTGYGDVHFKDELYDPKIGDINNDGYYDFVIVGDDGIVRTAYIFFGSNSYSLVGTEMTLDDADVRWLFVSD